MVGRSYSPDQLRKPLPESPSVSSSRHRQALQNVRLMGDESTKWCVSNVRPSGDMIPYRLGAANAGMNSASQLALSPITGSAQQLGDRENTVKDNPKNFIAVPTAPESS